MRFEVEDLVNTCNITTTVPAADRHEAEEDVNGVPQTLWPLAPSQDGLSYIMVPSVVWTTTAGAIGAHAASVDSSYIAFPCGLGPLRLVEEAPPVVSMDTSQAGSGCEWEEEEVEEEEEEENQSPHCPVPRSDPFCSAYCHLNQTAHGIVPMLVSQHGSCLQRETTSARVKADDVENKEC